MQKPIFFFMIIGLATTLVACTAPTSLPTSTATNPPPTFTAIPFTPTPIPPTETPKPLTHRDFEPLLIESGDLPSGFEPGQVFDEAPEMFQDLPKPELAIDQRFQKNGETKGGVVILVYQDQAMLDRAYNRILEGMNSDTQSDAIQSTSHEIEDLGEKAFYTNLHVEILNMVSEFQELVFTRCSSLVHIRMVDTKVEREILAYAKRLDQRLQDIVCQK